MIRVCEHEVEADLRGRLKVGLVGDLHLGRSSHGLLNEVIGILNANVADLICLVGDFVDHRDALPLLHAFVSVTNPLKFAVLGNHDYGVNLRGQKPDYGMAEAVASALRIGGVRVLRDEVKILEMKGKRVPIAGVEDLWVKKPCRNMGPVTLLLSHNPDVIFDDVSSGASLVLSAHTHGGSVRGVRLFALFSTRIGAHRPQGLHTYHGRRVWITSGIGKAAGVIRLGIDPEIVFLTLGRSSSGLL